MNKWQSLLMAIFFGMILSALILLVSSPRDEKPIILLPTTEPIQLKIHIAGEVNNPGVYALAPNSRVIDAVEQAGGFTPLASGEGLNLARFLVDGEYIQIPVKGSSKSITSSPSIVSSSDLVSSRINLNTATIEMLDQLPGIGTVKAQEIIDYRLTHGPFKTLQEIMNVPGIGAEIYEEIKDFLILD